MSYSLGFLPEVADDVVAGARWIYARCVYGPGAGAAEGGEALQSSELQLEANRLEDLLTQVRFNQLTQILLQAASIQRADLVAQGDRRRSWLLADRS